MSRPYDELMEKAECKQYALAKKIYQQGRADQKAEDNEFFNFEGAWELEKQKIRADAEDERANLLAFICKKYNIPLVDMNCTVDEWEQLKEQKNETK